MRSSWLRYSRRRPKGIVLNPLGVNMPLTVQKVKKQPEAPVQKPVSVEAQIDAAIREVQAEAGRE